MPRRSKSLLRRYLEARRRALAERPRVIREFLEELAQVLGDRASIIVFGGRAVVGIDSTEPRDLDLLIVISDNDDPGSIEELIYRLRPRDLPLDLIIARRSELQNSIAKQMLRTRIVVHDPLHVEETLND